MAYIPPACYCELCLMSEDEICAECLFDNDDEVEEFEEDEEE